MVLIFGWGRGEVQDRGDVVPIVCPNCHNQVFYREIRSQRQVSLYFVPIASSGSDVYLACPICRAGVAIPPGLRSSVDAMVTATRMVRTGQLAPDAYQVQADRLLAQVGLRSSAVSVASAPAQPTRGSSPADDTALTIAERVTALAKLHADGVLTDEEFAAAKRKVLEG